MTAHESEGNASLYTAVSNCRAMEGSVIVSQKPIWTMYFYEPERFPSGMFHLRQLYAPSKDHKPGGKWIGPCNSGFCSSCSYDSSNVRENVIFCLHISNSVLAMIP